MGVTLCAVSSFLPHDESAVSKIRKGSISIIADYCSVPLNSFQVVDGSESWTDPLYISYIIVCGISLIVFLVLINKGEAKAANEQYEIAYRAHLADGHVELVELAKALNQEMKHDIDQSNSEFRTKLLK